MAAGAEADTATVISQAEDYGWIKTELYDATFSQVDHRNTSFTVSSYDYVLGQ